MTNEELAIEIQNGHTEYYAVLWENCRRLLFFILHQKATSLPLPNYIDPEDLEQEMYFALCRAVQTFDRTKPYKLTTYFKYSISNTLREKMPDMQIEEVSYNEAVSDKDGVDSAELIDFIEDVHAAERFNDIEQFALAGIFKKALALLPELQRKVIVLRFYDTLTQKQVARLLGVTQSQVRNAEAKALVTLRKPHNRRQLADFI